MGSADDLHSLFRIYGGFQITGSDSAFYRAEAYQNSNNIPEAQTFPARSRQEDDIAFIFCELRFCLQPDFQYAVSGRTYNGSVPEIVYPYYIISILYR